jgi:hypothetical protein
MLVCHVCCPYSVIKPYEVIRVVVVCVRREWRKHSELILAYHEELSVLCA